MKYFIYLLLLFTNLSFAGISAKSFVVLDSENKIVLEKNPNQQLPIASITKYLFLSTNEIDFTKKYQVSVEDTDSLKRTKTRLKIGEFYDAAFLYNIALIHSNNEAVKALSRNTDNSIKTTNDYFSKFYKNTKIVEPSGLNPLNVSTAYDLASYANLQTGTIAAMTTLNSSVDHYGNTNPLLQKPGWKFLMSKTGFINESGGCFVVLLEIKQKIYSIAVLGSTDMKQRWIDLIQIRKQLDDTSFFEFSQSKQIKYKKRRKV